MPFLFIVVLFLVLVFVIIMVNKGGVRQLGVDNVDGVGLHEAGQADYQASHSHGCKCARGERTWFHFDVLSMGSRGVPTAATADSQGIYCSRLNFFVAAVYRVR
jgi:hypothetical protein